MADLFDEMSDDQLDSYISSAQSNLGYDDGPKSIFDEMSEEQLDSYIEGAKRQVKPLTAGEAVAGGMGRILDSLTFGAGDEITAAGASIIDRPSSIVDLIRGGDSPEYTERLKQVRDIENRYRDENPTAATALDIGSGLLGFGKAAAKTITKAPSLIGKTLRGAGTGLATGGLFGFLEGEGEEDRIQGAKEGAVIGAGIGTLLGPVTYGLDKAARSKGIREARRIFKTQVLDKLGEEVGAVGSEIRDASGLSRAQEFTVRWLDEASDEQIEAAANRIRLAEQQGSPMTLFEALNLDQGYLDAKAVRMSPGGASKAGEFLQERSEGAAGRVEGLLDSIADTDTFEGAEKFRGRAETLVSGLEKERTKATKPLYDEAGDLMFELRNEQTKKIVEHPLVKKLIPKVKDTFADDLPPDATDYNFKLLQRLKESLSDQADAASSVPGKGGGSTAGKYKQLTDDLAKAMHKASDPYKVADAEYSRLSTGIDELKGAKFQGKTTYGIFQEILSSDPRRAASATEGLLNRHPKQVRKIVAKFQELGGDEAVADLRAGLRSALQDKIDSAPQSFLEEGSTDLVSRMFRKGSNAKRNVIEILGEEEAKNLFTKLEVEALIAKGQTAIGVTTKGFGADTAPALTTWKNIFGKVKNAIFSPKATAEAVFESLSPDENEIFAKELADEIFRPMKPTEFERLVEFKRDYDTYREAIVAATRGGERGAQRGAIRGSIDEEGGFSSRGAAGAAGVAGGAGFLYRPEKKVSDRDTEIQNIIGGTRGERAVRDEQLRSLINEKKNGAFDVRMPTSITDDLLNAVRKVESNDGDPNFLRSRAGAEGPYQLMPATGRRIHRILQQEGVIGLDEPYDPYDEAQSRKIARYHLEDGLRRFGDVELALADYNLGHEKLSRAIERAKSRRFDDISKYLNTETANYVPKIRRVLESMEA